MDEIPETEEGWRERLSADRFAVLRQGATEPAFTGTLLREKRDGTYVCGACGAELFDAGTKFESGTGWPSFTEPVNTERVELLTDTSHGMMRTEVRCRRCGSHLGHVFPDGPGPTGERFCINSGALGFHPREPIAPLEAD